MASADELWLGVRVGAEPELPRTKLASVAYALHSASAEIAYGLQCTGCVQAEALSPAVLELVQSKLSQETGLSGLSNGSLTNTFTITVTSTDVPKTVPGYLFSGVSSTLSFPDVGLATDVSVHIEVEHPAPSELLIKLEPPETVGNPLLLHSVGTDGSAPGMLVADYPAVPPASGSFEGLVGENMAGSWTLSIADDVAPNVDGTLVNWGITVTYFAHSKTQANGDLVVTGDVSAANLPEHWCYVKTSGQPCAEGFTQETRTLQFVAVGGGGGGGASNAQGTGSTVPHTGINIGSDNQGDLVRISTVYCCR